MGEENKNIEPVPYFIHEGMMQRMADCNKKLLIALIVAVIVLFLNNIVWIFYEGTVHGESQRTVYEQEADSRSVTDRN